MLNSFSKIQALILNLNFCFSMHFNKYEILSFQQMHNLLKHKNATVCCWKERISYSYWSFLQFVLLENSTKICLVQLCSCTHLNLMWGAVFSCTVLYRNTIYTFFGFGQT
jgi:hypothetical protein